jgi:peptide/nickel transport system substrate-binding protein
VKWTPEPGHAAHRFAPTLTRILLLGLTSFACAGRADSTFSRSSTVTLTWDEDAVIGALDSEARFLVFLPLTAWNERGELEGRLARSWEPSPDHRELTYHLRTDVRWHDGAPVTAHDVAFTLKLLTRPEVAEMAPSTVESVTVHNDSTVTVRARSTWYSDQWWAVVLPRHLLENEDPNDFREWEFWKRPVGNGPYRFHRYVPRTLMEFEANPDHYRGKPRIERVVLKFASGAALTELLSGNVDAVPGVTLAQLRTLASDRRFEVYHHVSVEEARVIYWRTDHPILGDPRVRKALTLAIDRRGLLQLLDFPSDGPLVDGPFTVRQIVQGDLPEPLPHDPDAARGLLAAAGWIDADGDGIRERDGTELRFSAVVGGYFAQPGWQEMVIFIQDQLRGVGARMDIEILAFEIAIDRLRQGDFEAEIFWINVASVAWMQRSLGEGNRQGFKSPRVVELLDRAAATLDPVARDSVYKQLAEIFREELPVTFLFPDVWSWVAHRRLRGLSSPWRVDPLTYMEYLWLEDEP